MKINIKKEILEDVYPSLISLSLSILLIVVLSII